MKRLDEEEQQDVVSTSLDTTNLRVVLATRLSMAILLVVAALQLEESFHLQTQIPDGAWVGTITLVLVGLLLAGCGWLTCESIKNSRK